LIFSETYYKIHPATEISKLVVFFVPGTFTLSSLNADFIILLLFTSGVTKRFYGIYNFVLRKNYALAYDGRQVRSCSKLSTGTISTTLQCRTVRWCTCLLIVVQQTTRHRFAKTQLMRQDRFDFFHGMVRCSSCARHSSYHVNLNVSIQH